MTNATILKRIEQIDKARDDLAASVQSLIDDMDASSVEGDRGEKLAEVEEALDEAHSLLSSDVETSLRLATTTLGG